ncbi:MAG: hypothetical protein M1824_001799 [Vezdaea acicularis]|nr:MAG: hypothetical protein M1824_001799 [Vezdaea acicularis]
MASLSPPPALPLSNPESTATSPSNSSLDTLSKLSKDFERLESIWLSSACRASVLRIIQDGKDDAGTITTSSVCLGLGSLSTEGRRRSLFQLIALMDINKSLGISQTYAQDPIFDDTDHNFLSSRGVTVLPFPSAETYVEPASLLFAPHLEHGVLLPLLSSLGTRLPSVIICNDMQRVMDSAQTCAEDRETAQGFLSQYKETHWPDFEDDTTAFNDLVVYSQRKPEKIDNQ